MGISFSWLMIVIPILWILGVNLGYFLGRWFAFFNQFGRFAAIGFTNAAVDFGILNILIAWSGIASGTLFAVFKTISFIIAVTHSYLWNRYWVFSAEGVSSKALTVAQDGSQFFKFISIYIVSTIINVGIASAVVNGVDPFFNLDKNAWANIGSVAGSAMALIFSFAGIRQVVFKKKKEAISGW